MPNALGVMQGRLLPKYLDRYQAFPVDNWSDEFKIASSLDLELIEFILDFDTAPDNPLLFDSGCESIRLLTRDTGVSVKTICADYFMVAPLHSSDTNIVSEGLSILSRLCDSANILGISDIVIPCVDDSSLRTDHDIRRLSEVITEFIEYRPAEDVRLCLETDLSPLEFKRLLNLVPVDRVGVNYDIGNSASLGFRPKEEFAAYGDKITDVHIKDRKNGGGSVPLGTGDADLNGVMSLLKLENYHGPLIMQVYRDNEGIEIFKEQLRYFKNNVVS